MWESIRGFALMLTLGGGEADPSLADGGEVRAPIAAWGAAGNPASRVCMGHVVPVK